MSACFDNDENGFPFLCIALQKHLFEHDETGSAKVESTGDSLEPERKPVKPRPLSSQSNIRRKIRAAKKFKVYYLLTTAEPQCNATLYNASAPDKKK